MYFFSFRDGKFQNIPNISFFSGGSLKNCAAQGDGFDVEFFNSSQSSSDITSYTFDWGDGSSETVSGADFPANANGISHTFEIGVFTVVISAINSMDVLTKLNSMLSMETIQEEDCKALQIHLASVIQQNN